jgi:hypothetical protein
LSGLFSEASQWLSAQSDLSLFAIAAIRTRAINGVGMNTERVIPKALLVALDLAGQIGALIVGVPTEQV